MDFWFTLPALLAPVRTNAIAKAMEAFNEDA
jgi:hypothetical protein